MDTYQELFDAYLADMRGAMSAARAWWSELEAREGSAPAGPGRPALADRWPFGAASHPFVIACYRKWSLECEALNDRLEASDDDDDDDEESEHDEDQWGREDSEGEDGEDGPKDFADLEAPVEARELLIQMLPGRADDVAEFLALFVFDPVGMDRDDRLV